MRAKLIISSIWILSIGLFLTCYFIKPCKENFNDLVSSNVEALTFDEWGGGNDVGGGVISWYDHQRIDIEFHYCDTPMIICDCIVKTCHG